jgi:hypothetical protein
VNSVYPIRNKRLIWECGETIMATATGHDVVSPIRILKPELPLSAPSINSEPVELDSTPTSPEKMRARRASRDELLAELGGEEKEVCVVVDDEFWSNRKI